MPYYGINHDRHDHKVHRLGYKCGERPAETAGLGQHISIAFAVAEAHNRRYDTATACADCKCYEASQC